VNLKIVHRLPAEDDRRLVGATMNLSPAHERFLSTLPTGQAVVFAEGRELACHLSIPNTAHQLRKPSTYPSKAEVVEHMKTKSILPPAVPDQTAPSPRSRTELPACHGCTDAKCAMRPTILRTMAEEEGLADEFKEALVSGWDALWRFGLSAVGKTPLNNKAEAAFCLLMNIAAFTKFDKPTIEKMKTQLHHRRVGPIAA
jgi:hypothetical protein